MAGLLLLCAAMMSGCAATHAGGDDRLESWNRATFRFNESLDRALIEPAASAYQAAIPAPARTGVRNFFSNLDDAWSAFNGLLQLKIGDAAQNAMRVVLNTTVGLAGVLDVASELGVERHKENFGRTLGRWGVPSGPYLVLPFFGPSDARSALSLPVDLWGWPGSHVSPVSDRNFLFGLDAAQDRVDLLPATQALEAAALDKYLFVRDAYLQRRERDPRE